MSADEAERVVVDASVGVKWLLRDEPDLDAADGLLRRWDLAEVMLFAPHQISVEVANALRKAVLNRRISVVEAQQALSRWLQGVCPRLVLAGNEDLLPLAFDRALALGITLFDALYIVLAEQLNADLVVADVRLLKAAASQLAFLRPLQTDQ